MGTQLEIALVLVLLPSTPPGAFKEGLGGALVLWIFAFLEEKNFLYSLGAIRYSGFSGFSGISDTAKIPLTPLYARFMGTHSETQSRKSALNKQNPGN